MLRPSLAPPLATPDAAPAVAVSEKPLSGASPMAAPPATPLAAVAAMPGGQPAVLGGFGPADAARPLPPAHDRAPPPPNAEASARSMTQTPPAPGFAARPIGPNAPSVPAMGAGPIAPALGDIALDQGLWSGLSVGGAPAATVMPDRLAAPDLPPQLARQLSQGVAALARDPGAAVEIALDPPELGRVRLTLVEVSGVMTLSITAERPETADLMRRHMALLSEEFARQGLDGPSVNISGGGDGRQGARDPRAVAPEPRSIGEFADAAPTRAPTGDADRPRPADAGMDLRL